MLVLDLGPRLFIFFPGRLFGAPQAHCTWRWAAGTPCGARRWRRRSSGPCGQLHGSQWGASVARHPAFICLRLFVIYFPCFKRGGLNQMEVGGPGLGPKVFRIHRDLLEAEMGCCPGPQRVMDLLLRAWSNLVARSCSSCFTLSGPPYTHKTVDTKCWFELTTFCESPKQSPQMTSLWRREACVQGVVPQHWTL